MQVVAARSLEEFVDQSFWAGIGLVVALLALAWIAHRLRAWYGEDEDRTAANHELLSRLLELRREGDVSEDEYRSIKGRLKGRMDD